MCTHIRAKDDAPRYLADAMIIAIGTGLIPLLLIHSSKRTLLPETYSGRGNLSIKVGYEG